MDDEDDFFSTPEEGFDRAQGGASDPLVESEFQRIATRYSDAGYREGITSGKLSTLQRGFDQGFLLSASPSRHLGTLRGRANALLSYLLFALPMSTKTSSPGLSLRDTGLPSDSLLEELRDLIRDLGRIKRDDILPLDREREEHEAEHGEGEGRKGELEDLERGMEDMGGSGGESSGSIGASGGMARISGETKEGQQGATLLHDLEARLDDLNMKLRG